MTDCPKWLLPEAKKEWERLCVKLSEMGVLTEIDMAAFAAYCQSYARWKEAQELGIDLSIKLIPPIPNNVFSRNGRDS